MDRHSIKKGSHPSTSPSVADVRQNPFCLDDFDVKTLKGRLRIIVTNEFSEPISDEVSIKFIAPPSYSILRRVCAHISPVRWITSSWSVSQSTNCSIIPGAAKMPAGTVHRTVLWAMQLPAHYWKAGAT